MQSNISNNIAVVGISCRFPEAKNYHEYWRNLINNVDSVKKHKDWRKADNSIICDNFAPINDKYKFDNDLFNISPREAIHMDPQQRLLLEETWHCIEDSGIPINDLQQKCTSVFVGALPIDPYFNYLEGDEVDNYTGSGSYPFMLANRISYFWGFNGISKVIDTACSSAFMGLYDACIALADGSSDYAIVSGIHLHHSPMKYAMWSKNYMLTSEGKCNTFDKNANGIVVGEGVGVVLLQSLNRAIAERNHIYGVLKSCSMNHGGKSISVSSPKVKAQRDVILAALEKAEISPDTITYIETHGTGTSLGDPIEVEALKQAFEKHTNKKNFCKIGSVKTNIGHLMPAAGIASLIKVLLMLKYHKVPALLNFSESNPIIDFEDSPFLIPFNNEDWTRVDDQPLRAGISCFGYGGVNGHVIIEEYICQDKNIENNKSYPLLFSAQTPNSLLQYLKKWNSEINNNDSLFQQNINDICLTQLFSRTALSCRCGIWVKDKNEILEYVKKEDACIDLIKKTSLSTFNCIGKIDLTGYCDVRCLFEEFPILFDMLRSEFDSLENVKSLIEVHYFDEKWPVEYVEAFRFIFAYVLCLFFVELGVTVGKITGVGNGVWVALAISKMLDLESILNVLLKNPILDSLRVSRPILPFYDVVNAENIKPCNVDLNYVKNLSVKIEIPISSFIIHQSKFRSLLKNQFTFRHYLEEWRSFMSIPEIEAFLASEDLMSRGEGEMDNRDLLLMLALFSSLQRLNKKWGLPDRFCFDNEYFKELLMLLVDNVVSKDVLIEILLGQYTLSNLPVNNDNISNISNYKYLNKYGSNNPDGDVRVWIEKMIVSDPACIFCRDDELFFLMGAISMEKNANTLSLSLLQDNLKESVKKVLLDLWVRGCNIKWDYLYNEPYKKVPLPLYEFEKKTFILPRYMLGNRLKHNFLHPLLHQNVSTFSNVKFCSIFYGNEFYLEDHIIDNKATLPGVAYIEMIYKSISLTCSSDSDDLSLTIKGISWPSPFFVQDTPQELYTELSLKDELITFKVYSRTNDDSFKNHCQGFCELIKCRNNDSRDLQSLLNNCDISKLNKEECYDLYGRGPIKYGDSFQCINSVYFGYGEALAEINVPHNINSLKNAFYLNPCIMDSVLQSAVLSIMNADDDSVYLPFGVKEILILKPVSANAWASIVSLPSESSYIKKFDIEILDEKGLLCVSYKEISFKVFEPQTIKSNILLFHPLWDLPDRIEKQMFKFDVVLSLDFESKYISSCELDKNNFLCFTSEANSVEHKFIQYTSFVFDLCKKILQEEKMHEIIVRVFYPRESEYLIGLYGFFKSLTIEHPAFHFQLMGVDSTSFMPSNANMFNDLSLDAVFKTNDDGVILIKKWQKIPLTSVSVPWKNDGVYVITGGSGGLGGIIAQDIFQKTKNSIVILLARSDYDNFKNKISQLKTIGGTIEYHSVNVNSFEELQACFEFIKKKYSKIDGILHCAGIIKDRYFQNKNEQDFIEVQNPKVLGTVNLDQVTKNIPLDFFVCFSSVSAVFGNAGQTDYATANGFMDSYMKYRNRLVVSGERFGKSVAIDWPLWETGGMKIPVEYIQQLEKRLGIIPMNTTVGIEALYFALNNNFNQVMVLQGDSVKIENSIKNIKGGNKLMQENKKVKYDIADSHFFNKNFISTDNLVKEVVDIFAELLNINPSEIGLSTNFDEYGCDSIVYTEFSSQLNLKYKLDLTPTLFFEHTTIAQIVKYLENKVENQQDTRIHRPKTTLVSQNNEISIKDNTRENSDIAVIGMSGKFPMADGLDTLWDNLLKEKDCISEIPEERFKAYKNYLNADVEKIKWGGLISDIDKFDPLFFGISPKEAESMDPQQRLLLMHAWNTIEDAGYSAQQISGSDMGVFVAAINSGYGVLRDLSKTPIEGYSFAGIVPSIGANRISYFFNVHGPSEIIETACSSSLVAIHRAISAINTDECKFALVGGINLILTPEAHLSFDKAGMLSADGRCRTFSDKANGYVRGEGVGMLLLKKLSAAETDRDNIYGIIRGSAVNHGGKSNSLTAPNPTLQARVLTEAYKRSNVDPRTITYIETHGTGTRLGDPIEIDALKLAFKRAYKDHGLEDTIRPYCGLGTIKSNIGHLEMAAGVAGVIKVLLQIKNKMLVKSLHSEPVSPYIRLDSSPFYVINSTQQWNRLVDDNKREIPYRAGVSSFGFGGVNAHIVIEEYRKKVSMGPLKDIPYIMVLSAQTEKALYSRIIQFLKYICENDCNENLHDITYTLQVGRDAMTYRFALLVTNVSELTHKLEQFVNGDKNVDNLFMGSANKGESISTILEYDDLSIIIKNWIDTGQVKKILKAWVSGLNVDWNLLYEESNRPSRVSLPAYSFDLNSYWICNDLTNPLDDDYSSIIDGLVCGHADVDSVAKLIIGM